MYEFDFVSYRERSTSDDIPFTIINAQSMGEWFSCAPAEVRTEMKRWEGKQVSKDCSLMTFHNLNDKISRSPIRDENVAMDHDQI